MCWLNWGHSLFRVQCDRSYGLLVVRQGHSGFPSHQIPQPDGWIVTSCKKSKQMRLPVNQQPRSNTTSHGFSVCVCVPVMTWGSAAWHLTVATVLVCPLSVCTLALVLMSHTCKAAKCDSSTIQIQLSTFKVIRMMKPTTREKLCKLGNNSQRNEYEG